MARASANAPPVSETASFSVEPMRLGDIPAVMDIERVSFPSPWPAQAYEYELQRNPNSYFIVACLAPSAAGPAASRRVSFWQRLLGTRETRLPGLARSVVGFAGMWMLVDEAHISTIASHPQWRGRGIGELLLVNMIREAERRGACFVTLEVRVGNTVAQNLYRKYRFENVGLRKHYYRDNGEDAIIMTVQSFQEPAYKARLTELEALLRDRLTETRSQTSEI